MASEAYPRPALLDYSRAGWNWRRTVLSAPRHDRHVKAVESDHGLR